MTAIAFLLTYWFQQHVPLAAKAIVAAFVLVSLARPALGLLVFAGVAPLSTAIAGLCGGAAGLGGQMLEQMALSVGAGVLLRGWATEGRTRVGAPALLMAVVAVASAVAMIPAAAALVTRSFWDGLQLQQMALRPMALASPVWGPLFAAILIVECGLLGWAVERTVRRTPQLATWLILIALLGHSGAALLSLNKLVGMAMRSGDVLGALPGLLATVRFSTHMDLHAAASALLLAGVAGIGLMTGSVARQAGIGVLLTVTAAGLWITGSRVAIVLGVVAAVVAIGAVWRPAARVRGWRFAVAGVAILVVAAGIWLTTVYPARRYDTVAQSTNSRLVMYQAGVRMFEGSPAFGIGIARFYPTSAEVVGPVIQKAVGFPRENAHNNFLQVLAEQGLVGLGAMLWWLASILLIAWRARRSQPDPLRAALLVAIVACIGTWMTGHPLLVPEFALLFWLYCGVLAAWTPAPPNSRLRWVPWVLAAGVLISVPLRARALLNAVDQEHRGFGLSSHWRHDDQQRYRDAGASFSLYLPATGRPVELPIRRAPGAPDPLQIDVRIGDRLIDRLTVGSEAWQTLLIVVPTGPRRFELVDFAVRPLASAASSEVLLRVGRDAVR